MKAKHLSFFWILGLSLFFAGATAGTAVVSQQEILKYQKQLASRDPSQIFLAVAEIHQKLPKSATLIAGLKKLLKVPALDFRPLVALTLDKLGDPQGIRFLIGLGQDESMPLAERLKAIRYLGQSANPQASEALALFKTNREESIRVSAVSALLRKGIYPAEDEFAVLFSEASMSQKLVLLEALSKKEAKFNFILIGLRDQNAAVAAKALQVFAASKNADALILLMNNLAEIQDRWVVMEAELVLADRTQYSVTKIGDYYLAANNEERSNLIRFLKYREVFYKKGVKSAIDLIKSLDTDQARRQEMETPLPFTTSNQKSSN